MNNFSNYDPKIISIYEILGSYFTDILFNHIFLLSKNSKNVIDEYVKNVQNYISGIKNNVEYYNKCIKEIYQYFLKNVGKKYMDLKIIDFISRVISVSVPPDQCEKLSMSDKEDLFSNIITELMSNVAAFVTNPEMIQLVVIHHNKNARATIRCIQDQAVNFLIEKRALLFNSFVKNVGEVKEHTAVAYTEDLKKSLKKAIKEKNDAIADLEDALDEIDQLKKKNHNYKKELEASKAIEVKLRKFVQLLNVKSERGIIAAANFVNQPQSDTIAETYAHVKPYEELPKKETIAEKNNLSNFFAKPLTISGGNAAASNAAVSNAAVSNAAVSNNILSGVVSNSGMDELDEEYLNLLK